MLMKLIDLTHQTASLASDTRPRG